MERGWKNSSSVVLMCKASFHGALPGGLGGGLPGEDEEWCSQSPWKRISAVELCEVTLSQLASHEEFGVALLPLRTAFCKASCAYRTILNIVYCMQLYVACPAGVNFIFKAKSGIKSHLGQPPGYCAYCWLLNFCVRFIICEIYFFWKTPTLSSQSNTNKNFLQNSSKHKLW